MLIQETKFSTDIFQSKVVLITGAGGGIGYEAARAFAYLGADVVIAEINEEKGIQAQQSINNELHTGHASFFHVDLTDDKQIDELYSFVINRYGSIDVLFNNATIAPLGAVDVVPLTDWDKSYAVNLRAPVLLTKKFLPLMKQKNSGIIVFVPSSGAAPYMGAYEVFKTAQVELCNTLYGELENTDIITYAIGPGLVKTETAQKAIEIVASLMGISLAEFYEMNEKHILDIEMAGVGFAVSAVNAARYNGQEIGAIQALMDADILIDESGEPSIGHNQIESSFLSSQMKKIATVFCEQYSGWLKRNVFERQWVLRDFKKTVGMGADSLHKVMTNILEQTSEVATDTVVANKELLKKLKEYYIHQHKLLQGYEKNPQELEKNSRIILEWVSEVQSVIDLI